MNVITGSYINGFFKNHKTVKNGQKMNILYNNECDSFSFTIIICLNGN